MRRRRRLRDRAGSPSCRFNCTMSPQSSIAHYRITSKLGEGGMGAVYRATDTKLNRDIAIKVLPPGFAEDSTRMQGFEREAHLLASLNHANIAAIYGIEACAIVMELVEGADLAGPETRGRRRPDKIRAYKRAGAIGRAGRDRPSPASSQMATARAAHSILKSPACRRSDDKPPEGAAGRAGHEVW